VVELGTPTARQTRTTDWTGAHIIARDRNAVTCLLLRRRPDLPRVRGHPFRAQSSARVFHWWPRSAPRHGSSHTRV